MEDITKEKIAALLRNKRRDAGLTGGEVVQKLKAYGIDISDKSLWGYENCVSAPAVPTFIALCKIYGVEDLSEEFRILPEKVELDERERTLIRYFRSASPELQNAALRMLEPQAEDTTSMVG